MYRAFSKTPRKLSSVHKKISLSRTEHNACSVMSLKPEEYSFKNRTTFKSMCNVCTIVNAKVEK